MEGATVDGMKAYRDRFATGPKSDNRALHRHRCRIAGGKRGDRKSCPIPISRGCSSSDVDPQVQRQVGRVRGLSENGERTSRLTGSAVSYPSMMMQSEMANDQKTAIL